MCTEALSAYVKMSVPLGMTTNVYTNEVHERFAKDVWEEFNHSLNRVNMDQRTLILAARLVQVADEKHFPLILFSA
jgi:hypothetical protein